VHYEGCPHQTLYTRSGIKHRWIGNFIHMSPSNWIFRASDSRAHWEPARPGPGPAQPPVCTLCMEPQGGRGESAIESRPGLAPDRPGPLYVLYVWSPSPPEYKKVTVVQLVKCLPLGVKALGSILALVRFLPESKSSPSSILTNLGPLSAWI
jgi:hypothetical protein